MAKTDPLRRAKQRALDALETERWFMGLGITRKDSEPALLLSVRKSAKGKAERALRELGLSVPVLVREVERIRALPRRGKTSGRTAPEIEALREAVRRRS